MLASSSDFFSPRTSRLCATRVEQFRFCLVLVHFQRLRCKMTYSSSSALRACSQKFLRRHKHTVSALLWPFRMTSISSRIKRQCREIGQLAGLRARTFRKKTGLCPAGGSAFSTSLFSIKTLSLKDLRLGKTKLS